MTAVGRYVLNGMSRMLCGGLHLMNSLVWMLPGLRVALVVLRLVMMLVALGELVREAPAAWTELVERGERVEQVEQVDLLVLARLLALVEFE